MNERTMRTALMLVLTCCLTACGIGKEKVVFVTKTSLGVDMDTTPPSLDVGFSRQEGTIAPHYDEGVLPQVATFRTDVQYLVNAAVGQSFATGHAATILAKYYGTDASARVPDEISIDEIRDASVSRVDGSIDEGRPYYFGTDTNFSLSIGFGLETAPAPDSLSLGYKRKELAWVPVSEVDRLDEDGQVDGSTVGLPPLLATSALDVVAGDTYYNQIFATGLPASFLAANKDVREVLGERILGEGTLKRSLSEEDLQAQPALDDLTEAILGLDDDRAVALFWNPPVTTQDIEGLVTARLARAEVDEGDDPPPDLARQLSVMRLNAGPRDGESIAAWTAALDAPEWE